MRTEDVSKWILQPGGEVTACTTTNKGVVDRWTLRQHTNDAAIDVTMANVGTNYTTQQGEGSTGKAYRSCSTPMKKDHWRRGRRKQQKCKNFFDLPSKSKLLQYMHCSVMLLTQATEDTRYKSTQQVLHYKPHLALLYGLTQQMAYTYIYEECNIKPALTLTI